MLVKSSEESCIDYEIQEKDEEESVVIVLSSFGVKMHLCSIPINAYHIYKVLMWVAVSTLKYKKSDD